MDASFSTEGPVPPDVNRIIKGLKGVSDEVDQRSREATRIFNESILPVCQAFVDALLPGKGVKVVAYGGTPCTDGKTIYLRPPIELADKTPHLRGSKCDEIDPVTYLPVCPACVVREDALWTMCHETCHISANSFDSLTDEAARDIVIHAVREAEAGIQASREEIFAAIKAARDAGDAEKEAALVEFSRAHALYGKSRVEKLAERLASYTPRSYIEAASIISAWLPLIINALEDVRVNQTSYTARPGTYRMSLAQTLRIFNQGIQRPDGTYGKWIDLGHDSQMVCGLLVKAAGMEQYREGWFSPEVLEALEDEELSNMLVDVPHLPDVASVYHLAFPVLERIRKLGFCKASDDLEDDPQPEPVGKERRDDNGTTPEGEGEGAGGGGSKSDHDDESEETESGGGEAGDDPDEAGREGESDDETESGEGESESESGAGDGDEPEQDGEQPGSGDTPDHEGDEPSKAGLGTDDPEGDDEGEGNSAGSGCTGDGPVRPAMTPEEQQAAIDEANAAMKILGGHGEVDPTPEQEAENAAIARAVEQEGDFDCPSKKVFGVNVHRYDRHVMIGDRDLTEEMSWSSYSYRSSRNGMNLGKPAEGVLGPSMLRMRAAFAANKTAKVSRNKEAGRIDPAALARGVATGKRNFFMEKKYPGKKDYFVLTGIDLSGSTDGSAIGMEKEAAIAFSELCHRTGVRNAIYGHTGSLAGDVYRYGDYVLNLDIFEVKAEHELWGSEIQKRLAALSPASANLDGHTLEFYRKRCEESRATDKIIVYFTDGLMPCENHDEELVILQREIKICQRLGITLLGVGVGTDSPSRHGLDTVRLDSMADLPKVVAHLGKRMAKGRAA